jgi:hypothetical protein
MCISAAAFGQQPTNFFEAVSVTPSRVIDHDVDLKGPFDKTAVETILSGPVYFSQAVGTKEVAINNRCRSLPQAGLTRAVPRKVFRQK